MELDVLPKSLVVVGGGFVGLEQAQLFARLGSGVTVVGRIAPHAEPELSTELEKALADDGIHIIADRATEVDEVDGQVRVTTGKGF